MLKRLSSLVMILALSGGAIAATPPVQRRHGCQAQCCKAERKHCDTPEVHTLRLCCVAGPQTPLPAGTTFHFRAPSFGVGPLHPALTAARPKPPGPVGPRHGTARPYSPNLRNIYIRNLSLLN